MFLLLRDFFCIRKVIRKRFWFLERIFSHLLLDDKSQFICLSSMKTCTVDFRLIQIHSKGVIDWRHADWINMPTAKLSESNSVNFQIKSCNLTWIVPGVEAMAGAVFLPILTNRKWYFYSLAACWRLSFFVFLKKILLSFLWMTTGIFLVWKSRPEAHQKMSICSNLGKTSSKLHSSDLGKQKKYYSLIELCLEKV